MKMKVCAIKGLDGSSVDVVEVLSADPVGVVVRLKNARNPRMYPWTSIAYMTYTEVTELVVVPPLVFPPLENASAP